VHLAAALSLRGLVIEGEDLRRRVARRLAGLSQGIRRGEDVVRRGVVRIARAHVGLEVAVDVLDPRFLDILDHGVDAAGVHEQGVAVLLHDRGIDRPGASDRTDPFAVLAVVQDVEARDAALGFLLVDHVGLGQTDLRPGLR
jgi:hypothetical protein